MTSEAPRTCSDTPGVAIGLSVFFVGIGLLVLVFLLAFRMFGDPGVLTALASQGPAAAGGQGAAPSPMTGALVKMGQQVVVLFVMLLAGSLVASKGIHLYAAGR
ncbi:MAG: hypothetical protein HY321_13350 [Armatimonadetes bacterium]|nr:hypothetical protein [Armatimonadota bacterium]